MVVTECGAEAIAFLKVSLFVSFVHKSVCLFVCVLDVVVCSK